MRAAARFLLLTGLVLGGCGADPVDERDVVRVHLGDPAEQLRLKEAMAAARIPHKIVRDPDKREFVVFGGKKWMEVNALKRKMSGRAFMENGRNMSFSGKPNEEFKAWLVANDVAIDSLFFHSREWHAWSAKDTPRLLKYEPFAAQYRAIPRLPDGTPTAPSLDPL